MTTMPPPAGKSAAPPSNNEAAQAKLRAKEAKKEKRAAALAARPEAAPEASTSKAGAASAAGVGPAGRSGAAKSEQAGTSRKADGAASAKTAAAAPAPSHLPQDLLFSHLPSAHDPDTYLLRSGGKFKPHTIVARLGQLIASGEVKGTNARTIGLLSAFKMVIRDFGCPPEQMHRLLPAHISPMIAYLDHCRPKGVGGGNAIRWLKSEINKVGTDERITTESEQRDYLCDAIDQFLAEKIELADEVISGEARNKLRAGDVIVTYGRSSLVEKILLDAWAGGERDFSVIVVDAGPLFEGKALLKVFVAVGIPCSYCLLPSLPAAIPRATKVLLGAAAMLSDGALYSRAGTAMVAMLAKENRIPVIACCEGYKFGDKVVLDAVTGNEKGHVDELRAQSTLPTLSRINLMYDLTPPSLITMVCTEVGNIPPSSVPTVMQRGDAEAL